MIDYRFTRRACYVGYFIQAIIVNLAPLLFVIFQRDFGVTLEQLGNLILSSFLTQMAADLISMRYGDKLGYRLMAIISHGACFVGLLLLGLLPKLVGGYFSLMIPVMIYSFGGGMLEVLINPVMDSLPQPAKGSQMVLLHSFYSWGQVGVTLLSTLFIFAFGERVWFYLPIIWSILPLCNLFCFMKAPLLPPVSAEARSPLKELLKSPSFLLFLLIMVCAGASELVMSQWASFFAEKGLGVSKLMGDILGPCLFAAFMGVGRLLYGFVGHKINLKYTLFATSALTIVCYMVAVFAPSALPALLACALCGFTVSLMWPGTLSLSSKRFPMGGTMMFGLLAILGDLGGSIGPWLAGLVSQIGSTNLDIIAMYGSPTLSPEQLGLKLGILVTSIFPIMLFISSGLLILRGKATAKKAA